VAVKNIFLQNGCYKPNQPTTSKSCSKEKEMMNSKSVLGLKIEIVGFQE
jgi:hypothetical protein